jgi:hypothetical protein
LTSPSSILFFLFFFSLIRFYCPSVINPCKIFTLMAEFSRIHYTQLTFRIFGTNPCPTYASLSTLERQTLQRMRLEIATDASFLDYLSQRGQRQQLSAASLAPAPAIAPLLEGGASDGVNAGSVIQERQQQQQHQVSAASPAPAPAFAPFLENSAFDDNNAGMEESQQEQDEDQRRPQQHPQQEAAQVLSRIQKAKPRPLKKPATLTTCWNKSRKKKRSQRPASTKRNKQNKYVPPVKLPGARYDFQIGFGEGLPNPTFEPVCIGLDFEVCDA